jgi:ribosome-binding factor A
MSRDFPRSRRIEDQIQRSLSEIIRTHVRDPRLHGVVITGVDVSRDLSVAWVYFSSLDGQQDRATLENAFESALGFLRTQLAGHLTVRHVPELRMRYDDTTWSANG